MLKSFALRRSMLQTITNDAKNVDAEVILVDEDHDANHHQ